MAAPRASPSQIANQISNTASTFLIRSGNDRLQYPDDFDRSGSAGSSDGSSMSDLWTLSIRNLDTFRSAPLDALRTQTLLSSQLLIDWAWPAPAP